MNFSLSTLYFLQSRASRACLPALLSALLLAPAASPAGTFTVGDGGFGVFCRKPSGQTTAEFLDLYEARQLFGFVPDLEFVPYNSLSSLRLGLRKAEFTMRDIYGNADAVRNFRRRATKLMALAQYDAFFAAHPVTATTDDTGPLQVKLPAHCGLQQFAITFPEDDFFMKLQISREFWDMMLPVDQVALIIHEALHPYFRHSPDTRALRQVVAFLTAPRMFRDRNLPLIKRVVSTGMPANANEFIRCTSAFLCTQKGSFSGAGYRNDDDVLPPGNGTVSP